MPVIHLIKTTSINKLTDSYNTTLLHFAAKYNNISIMKYLKERGCKIDAIDRFSRTPLVMAIMNESIDAVKFLLDANANIYLACFHGNSALKVATRYRKTPRSLAIVKHFFNRMTHDLAAHCFDDSEIADRLHAANCPLYRVVYLSNAEVTRLMLERYYCRVDSRDPDTGNTALHEAVNQRDLANILVLLRYGADVNVRNHKGQTSLVYKFADNVDVLRELLSKTKTVWIEADDADKEVMKLSQVFGKGTRQTVKLFLQENLEVNLKARDAFERTPLHYLMENTNDGVLELFDDFEFDVNALDKGNYAALHVAADRGDPDSVRFLLDKGADVNIKGYLGCTPLFYATAHMTFESQRKKKCIELLMLYGADPEFTKDEETVVGIAQRIGMPLLIEPVIAHFALLEIIGKRISEKNRVLIDSHKPTKNYYEICKMKIEGMKEDKVYGSLMAYDILARDEYFLTKYVQVPEVMNWFKRDEFDCNSYYEQMMKRRFEKAVEINRLRKIAIRVVSDAVGYFHEDHIIIEIVVSFLDLEDLKRIT